MHLETLALNKREKTSVFISASISKHIWFRLGHITVSLFMYLPSGSSSSGLAGISQKPSFEWSYVTLHQLRIQPFSVTVGGRCFLKTLCRLLQFSISGYDHNWKCLQQEIRWSLMKALPPDLRFGGQIWQ